MQALSCHIIQTGCPWELLYVDDLVIIAETLDELLEKFCVWKTNLESKRLHVNVGKTKIMVSTQNPPIPVEANKFPCGVCKKGVEFNSIKWLVCGFWVHQCCSNIKGPLILNVRSVGVKHQTWPSQTLTLFISVGKKFKKSGLFVICDFIGQHGGCFNATTARIRLAWKMFREHLQILACHGLSLKTCGYACIQCMCA